MPSRPARAADAIILAGGTGERLGGVSKADLRLAGERLLDIVLEAVAPCREVVVVARDGVAVPPGVRRTLEDPPGGGPVAGIAAGLAALSPSSVPAGTDDGLVLVLACDMPGAAGAVPELLGAAGSRPPGADGVIAVHADGRRENLAVVATRGSLARALAEGGDRDRSMRSLLAQLSLVEQVIADDAALEDVDTWEQHARWESRRRAQGTG